MYLDEVAANSDVDDPLAARRLRRQPSTISGGSNEEDSNFSSASSTTAASSLDSDDRTNSNNNANMTTASDGVIISQQKKSTSAPVTFGRSQQQTQDEQEQQQQQHKKKESSKSGSKGDGTANNKLSKRAKHRRELAISASSFAGKSEESNIYASFIALFLFAEGGFFMDRFWRALEPPKQEGVGRRTGRVREERRAMRILYSICIPLAKRMKGADADLNEAGHVDLLLQMNNRSAVYGGAVSVVISAKGRGGFEKLSEHSRGLRLPSSRFSCRIVGFCLLS